MSCAVDNMESNHQDFKAYSDVEDRVIEPLLGVSN